MCGHRPRLAYGRGIRGIGWWQGCAELRADEQGRQVAWQVLRRWDAVVVGRVEPD